MGRDNKLLLPFGKTTVIEQVLEEVTQVEGLEIVLVSNRTEVTGQVSRLGVKTASPKGEICQSNSLKAGLEGISKETKGVFFILGDQPFIRSSLLAEMQAAFLYLQKVNSTRNIIVPYHGKKRGNPVLFSTDYLDSFNNLMGDEGARSIIKANNHYIFKMQVDDSNVLLDIDTPEDYHRALSLTGHNLA